MQILMKPLSAPVSVQKLLDQPVDGQIFSNCRYLVAISLAEAETLRRIIHVQQESISGVGLALRALEGGVIDKTEQFVSAGDADDDLAVGIQCMRFFNGDMWYSDDELQLLQKGLDASSLEKRLCFFAECLRLRRAERLLWEDTPLAKIFTAESEWHLLHMRARVEQVKRKMADKKMQPSQFFSRFDLDGDGKLSHKELVQAFEMDVGFSPADAAEVVKYLDQDKQGCVSLKKFTEVFAVQSLMDTYSSKDHAEAESADTDDMDLSEALARQLATEGMWCGSLRQLSLLYMVVQMRREVSKVAQMAAGVANCQRHRRG